MESTGFKPSEKQETAEIVETLMPIAILRLENSNGNQVTR